MVARTLGGTRLIEHLSNARDRIAQVLYQPGSGMLPGRKNNGLG
jgi:hypothetical protein